jgi:cytochrome P450
MRRLTPPGFFEAVHRVHPRLAYVRFGSEHAYFLFEPDLVRALLVDAGRSTTKGRGLQRSKELLGEGLLTSEGALHRRQRRLIQPAFHTDRVAGYAAIMCEEARLLSGGWRPNAAVSMSAEMSQLTMRIVGRSLFGTELTAADIDTVARALRAFLANFELLLVPAAALLGRLPTKKNRKMAQARADLDALMYRMIAEHRAAGDSGDLLSTLILVRDAEQPGASGDGMSDRQVRDEALTLLLAGHETTANALTWSWLLLDAHRPAAARLHGEVDLLGRPPEPTDLDALPFTRAVIAESMRLYPPAWVIGRRATEPIEVDEYTIPPGSLIATSQWIVHRDSRWWEDAAEFRPERWMTADGRFDEAAPGAPRGAYFPFGAGRRVCAGESFAWTEAVLVLATLAQVWAPAALPETDMGIRAAVTLRPHNGAPLRLGYRR